MGRSPKTAGNDYSVVAEIGTIQFGAPPMAKVDNDQDGGGAFRNRRWVGEILFIFDVLP